MGERTQLLVLASITNAMDQNRMHRAVNPVAGRGDKWVGANKALTLHLRHTGKVHRGKYTNL